MMLTRGERAISRRSQSNNKAPFKPFRLTSLDYRVALERANYAAYAAAAFENKSSRQSLLSLLPRASLEAPPMPPRKLNPATREV
jgi:hypothetical protein